MRLHEGVNHVSEVRALPNFDLEMEVLLLDLVGALVPSLETHLLAHIWAIMRRHSNKGHYG